MDRNDYLLSYLDILVKNPGEPDTKAQSIHTLEGVSLYFQRAMMDYNPDINGYTIAVMVPPDLSGYSIKNKELKLFLEDTCRFITFSAIDFSPPQSQINSETVSARTGAMPYATEVSETETCSITFIDTINLDIYRMHHIWLEYIRNVTDGLIEPDSKYLTDNVTSQYYHAIDYAASLYIIKYRPNMKDMTFIGKCLGIFPQSLPNKELIGSRATNELTTLPFSYYCALYREHVINSSINSWIKKELVSLLESRFGK